MEDCQSGLLGLFAKQCKGNTYGDSNSSSSALYGTIYSMTERNVLLAIMGWLAIALGVISSMLTFSYPAMTRTILWANLESFIVSPPAFGAVLLMIAIGLFASVVFIKPRIINFFSYASGLCWFFVFFSYMVYGQPLFGVLLGLTYAIVTALTDWLLQVKIKLVGDTRRNPLDG